MLVSDSATAGVLRHVYYGLDHKSPIPFERLRVAVFNLIFRYDVNLTS